MYAAFPPQGIAGSRTGKENRMSEAKRKIAKDETKSGHKSLRVRARTEFAAEFCAAISWQTETAFIEEAIQSHADARCKEKGTSWRRYFHPNPAVRKLRLFLLDNYPRKDTDEQLREFVMVHRAFFFDEVGDALQVNTAFVETLWPHLDELRALAERDYWAPGRRMAEHLTKRGLAAPAWPPQEQRS
jgi:hypothetical protein